MTTNVLDEFVTLGSNRTLESKLSDIISCLDYGATVGGTAAANTTAINSAITAAAASGFVLIPVGVTYTESSLVIPDGVTLLQFASDGTITFLTKDHASSPVAKGGICVKSQGKTGVLLRSHDYGVAADPVLQLIDETNGDLAAVTTKYIQLNEESAPTTPAVDKVRVYADVTGTDTRVMAKFQDGSAVVLARQGQYTLEGSATWDPGSIAHNAQASTNITVTGAVVGDFVLVSASIDTQELILTGHVGAADTVHAVLHNSTGGAVDLASATYYARVFKRF